MNQLQIGLPEIVAALIVVALNAYVLLGGADFGGGVWDLLASGPRRREQRALIRDSIAPIWEANHVWLIVVIVMLFTAFPTAFAALTTVLHVPLALMLVGIVLRGAAFVFRSYGTWRDGWQRTWGRIFAVASVITPLCLGAAVGAIASGRAGEAADMLHTASTSPASFAAVFVSPWLAPFPLAVGAFALVLFAFLAAVYLTAAAENAATRDDFRTRAVAAGVAVFIVAALTLAVSHFAAPRLRWGLLASRWAVPLQLATALSALTVFWALWRERWALARVAAAAQVSLILWGWTLAQFPQIVPPNLSIRDAAAPSITLELLLWGLAGGALILIPSLAYLFRTFAAVRAERPDEES